MTLVAKAMLNEVDTLNSFQTSFELMFIQLYLYSTVKHIDKRSLLSKK